jgi:hypothetical protein
LIDGDMVRDFTILTREGLGSFLFAEVHRKEAFFPRANERAFTLLADAWAIELGFMRPI